MTEALLNEALALFPSREMQREVDFAGWRSHIASICRFLRGITRANMRSLFDEARAQIEKTSFKEYYGWRLWLFSHPTFEIFEEFIADELLCRAFADYLEVCLVPRNQNKKHRKQLRRQTRLGLNDAHLLPVRYQSLLVRRGASTFSFYTYHRKKRAQHYISLVRLAETDTDAHSVQVVYEQIEYGILSDEVDKVKSALKANSDFKRIFQFKGARSLSNEELRILLADMILYLEIGGFEYEMSSSLKPISSVAAAITRAYRNRTWVKFTTEERIVSKVSQASLVRYEMDRSAISALIERFNAGYENLEERMRKIEDGLLSIGLKIHCPYVEAPGVLFLRKGYFAAHNAQTCFVLPPVGKLSATRELLETIERRAGVSYLNNPNFQIQVCTPGELTHRNAALLGIAFYLGSDRIRRYESHDFVTTHWSSGRLIIYGAEVLERSFDWWGKDGYGNLRVGSFPENLTNRTDVLTCQSMRDIANVNLVASLLVHVQWQGYWEELGREFIADMEEMLDRHTLIGLLDAVWLVKSDLNKPTPEENHNFIDALEQLTSYAYEEVKRINFAREKGDLRGESKSILFEMHELLDHYRNELVIRSPERR